MTKSVVRKMIQTHRAVLVSVVPRCDIHWIYHNKSVPAWADVLIPSQRRWGNLCKECFDAQGADLGLGKGQRLVLDTEYAEAVTS